MFLALTGTDTRTSKETPVIKDLQVLLDHPQAHPGDQDQADHRGLGDQGVRFLWMRHLPPTIKDLPLTHHLLLQN